MTTTELTIEEIRVKKAEAESKIASAVSDFKNETGLDIIDIELAYIDAAHRCGRQLFLSSVSCKVNL